MPKPSNASDGSFERDTIAEELYLARGADAAARRCEINQAQGHVDFAAELAASLSLAPGHRVADVCCGAGDHLERFGAAVAPGGRAFGIDFSADAVSRATARGCEAHRADACDQVALGQGLDAINCAFGIYYLADSLRALRAWAHALRPGGRLVVSGPAPDTNAELYEFHRAITGLPPSDADRMALGYVGAMVRPLLREAGFVETTMRRLVNPIRFEPAGFVEYWRMTSLFARSGLSYDPAQEERYRSHAPASVTKIVEILVARSEGP